ncbi:MAG: hypothetical protein A2583_00830 [Bdellovibrionales bacterium RIFOXYD1_FULL_53_11]|nr:MAG: hypothetical protein A2583_00830 [Bdellovibrionales bacterium RIFOXYD1_FULL_53_11]
MHNPDKNPLDGNWFNDLKRKPLAHWLAADAVAWMPPADSGQLEGCSVWLQAGGLRVEDGFIKARHSIRLDRTDNAGATPALAKAHPTWAGHPLFRNPELGAQAADLLHLDACLGVHRQDGRAIFATGLQLHGVFDDIAFYDGPDLGVSFDAAGAPTIKLWAPSSNSVFLHLFDKSSDEKPSRTIVMERGKSGVWTAGLAPADRNKFYIFENEVYIPASGGFVKNTFTDPYSTSLSINSQKSCVAGLSDKTLMPDGWESLSKPPLGSFNDIILYEMHVRDFSAWDESIAAELRGKYLAFTQTESYGMKHLRSLAAAGLTHIHLLPFFDFATVNDDPSQREEPAIPAGLPPDSTEPANILENCKDRDAFNWGYDPLHYLAPEGSFSLEPDGPARIRECREMVKGLNSAGLRVVLDVVFNHTYRLIDNSPTLYDKSVPGYYYRTNNEGAMVSTACGASGDLATDRRMMEKLMIDTLVRWAREYKVDGFRFDLMGFHTLDNMRAAKTALDALTPEKDGVDGKKIYLYGEGWKFGSTNDIRPGECCTQVNMFGSGIGTFNDRTRDAIRGGSSSAENKMDQGFGTGLYWDDNWNHEREGQKHLLLHLTDVLRIGLAGGLRDYTLKDYLGTTIKGGELHYKNAPAGYTASPVECINFVSSHDNYDLWDNIAAKAPFEKPDRKPPTATPSERVRMQRIALGLVMLGQGIPFFHAGSELLRSKSGDNNSYNSGDWFNRIDFTCQTNNWGAGLPPGENRRDWEFWAPRLRNHYLKPSPPDISETAEYFRELLSVRRDSPLLKLRTVEDIQARLKFLETDLGQNQTPGLIIMMLRDDIAGLPQVDPARHLLIIAINAALQPADFTHEALKGLRLQRHRDWTELAEPRLAHAKYDPAAGKLLVPPQSIAIYEQSRSRRDKS